MKEENSNPSDGKLARLLRTARVSPSLPPRFQENVWRRIEDAEAPVKTGSWLEALANLILRPRFALAAVTILVCAGAFFGVIEIPAVSNVPVPPLPLAPELYQDNAVYNKRSAKC